MNAVVQRQFGPPDVLQLEECDDPRLDADQVLIAVEFANTTFIETQLRAGRAPDPAMLPELPTIPGNGVGGTIRAVGSGVDPDWVGARVVASTGGMGGYAEFVAVPATALVAIPGGVGTTDATALLADGRTALALVRAADIERGDTVLVEAAGGGVGSLLVQLARVASARVIAAAGSAAKLDLATRLGAERAIDYTEPGWTSAADRVDVVFDGVGGEIARAAFELVRPGGRFCTFGLASGTFAPISPELAADRMVLLKRGTGIAPDEMAELSRRALELSAAGSLHPTIGQHFPLARAADAHAAIESRATIGKTLLTVSSAS